MLNKSTEIDICKLGFYYQRIFLWLLTRILHGLGVEHLLLLRFYPWLRLSNRMECAPLNITSVILLSDLAIPALRKHVSRLHTGL